MSWIREIDEGKAAGHIAETYARLINQRGKLSNILKVQSLNAGALDAHLDLYMQLMFGRSGLSRAERESIGVTVSAANRCDYCINHHVVALRQYEKDDQLIEQIITGDRYEDLPKRMGSMLSYARKLTVTPDVMSETDIEGMRSAGLKDDEVLDVALITAYFNFVNRLAVGLGVELTAEEMTGYKI
jgi:uncharacterized peroxidase-related enzyme